MENTKKIAILGSTGSIGTQALQIIDSYPQLFSAEIITANNNADLLIEQAIKYEPNVVVIANESLYPKVKKALEHLPIKVYAGEKAIEDVAEFEYIDIVLVALLGYAGLMPTIKAIKANKTIALANKECLVVAGNIIMEELKKSSASLIPVDSEHSAIFQCLVGEQSAIHKIILTASGGPFLNTPASEFNKITVEQALKHPRWDMGAKITIDSATLMNKGFEVIEARWLFDLDASKIEVVVHPESIIHSMVEFEDGSVKAQMGEPSMLVPIQYAFTYPVRLKTSVNRLNLVEYKKLNFMPPNMDKFACLKLAYKSLEKGGNYACILNAANEIAVKSFLEGKISFPKIGAVLEETINRATFIKAPSLNNYIESNLQARAIAESLI